MGYVLFISGVSKWKHQNGYMAIFFGVFYYFVCMIPAELFTLVEFEELGQIDRCTTSTRCGSHLCLREYVLGNT